MIKPMEPGTGAALQAGTEVAKTVADAKLRHALLLPAATAIGKHWGKNVDEWFEQARARRLHNLNEHVDRATAHAGGVEQLEAIADDPSFMEWAEAVSKVRPEDGPLSDIWQAALMALKEGGVRRLRILNIAKRMQPDEAAVFLNYARTGDISGYSKQYISKFMEYGLIEDRAPWRNSIFWWKAITYSFLPIMIVSFILSIKSEISDIFFQILQRFSRTRLAPAPPEQAMVSTFVVMFAIFFFVPGIQLLSRSIRPSYTVAEDGHTLKILVDQILSENNQPPEGTSNGPASNFNEEGRNL